MSPEDCQDKLRFRLGDDSGVLRFTEFTITNAPECVGIQQTLREYLVGRPLADVELDVLRRLSCRGNGECVQAVIQEVEKYQRLFALRNGAQPALR